VPLAPDHSFEIAGVDAQLKHGDLFAFDRTDLDLVRITHERLYDRLKQLLRRLPQRARRASAGSLASVPISKVGNGGAHVGLHCWEADVSLMGLSPEYRKGLKALRRKHHRQRPSDPLAFASRFDGQPFEGLDYPFRLFSSPSCCLSGAETSPSSRSNP